MKLSLFNTETRTEQVVEPIDGKTIRMYTCGPTIYDYAHIGNFRTYIVEDLLRRTLLYFGYKVEQAMNLTDVDDKTIRGAIAKGVSLKAFTEPYKIAFFQDLDALGIQRVEHYPAATETIPEMIEMIQRLQKKGFAYKSSNGSIYFSISKFPQYGRLSRLDLTELAPGASGENEADEYDKEHVADFALWKAYDPLRDGEVFWESPFGLGRPGWHIECSAMAMKALGKTLDLHCGGVDNMFPHHENEVAQSECYSGCCFVRHWLHVEHLLVDHRKMSKSLGNFYTLRDLIAQGYTGREVRYLLLSIHYRSQLNFTFPSLQGARVSLKRLSDFIDRLHRIGGGAKTAIPFEACKRGTEKFNASLAEDLNLSAALAALFEFVREVNILIDEGKLLPEEARFALDELRRWDLVLNVLPFDVLSSEIPAHLQQLLALREEARLSKNWAKSDQLRNEIQSLGYQIEDTPNGAQLKKRS
jgi:cysteinyl-tRNA synthetase